mmetsp:Transcript_11216/g.43263  ORF Transcript_11216/g.43263 Transcript_11216/m.43263 type:complete len:395 (+) Transcript_11216:374-1558(+)
MAPASKAMRTAERTAAAATGQARRWRQAAAVMVARCSGVACSADAAATAARLPAIVVSCQAVPPAVRAAPAAAGPSRGRGTENTLTEGRQARSAKISADAAPPAAAGAAEPSGKSDARASAACAASTRPESGVLPSWASVARNSGRVAVSRAKRSACKALSAGTSPASSRRGSDSSRSARTCVAGSTLLDSRVAPTEAATASTAPERTRGANTSASATPAKGPTGAMSSVAVATMIEAKRQGAGVAAAMLSSAATSRLPATPATRVRSWPRSGTTSAEFWPSGRPSTIRGDRADGWPRPGRAAMRCGRSGCPRATAGGTTEGSSATARATRWQVAPIPPVSSMQMFSSAATEGRIVGSSSATKAAAAGLAWLDRQAEGMMKLPQHDAHSCSTAV